MVCLGEEGLVPVQGTILKTGLLVNRDLCGEDGCSYPCAPHN